MALHATASRACHGPRHAGNPTPGAPVTHARRAPWLAWATRHARTLAIILALACAHNLFWLQVLPPPPPRENLVIYVFAATDPEFINNLRFFVTEAVAHDARSEYIIVVQQGTDIPVVPLPRLPRHARYVYHVNECYDWGTFGWVLASKLVDTAKYRYFFFINCSVRGPFLPSYARGKVPWTEPFTRRLVGGVRLVGPTISCEGSPLNGDFRGRWRTNPHVQSYVVATDQVGLSILQDDGRVFHCHNSRWNTIYYSELGSSTAVLRAGYNLGCFMAKYQGVDWRNRSYWDCNMRYSPQSEYTYDGVSLDPLEVMFVKVKKVLLDNGFSTAVKAAKYSQYLARDPANLTLLLSNEYVENEWHFKAPRVFMAKARGAKCFDHTYYLQQNPDLQQMNLSKKSAAWKHYVFYGQFEWRPHRFTCDVDIGAIMAKTNSTAGDATTTSPSPPSAGVAAAGGGNGTAASDS